mgnify:FL=1
MIKLNEYESAFPEEQEYQNWIASIEFDYRLECAERIRPVPKNNTEEPRTYYIGLDW